MENLQSKDINDEIVEISKETSVDDVSIEPIVTTEPKIIEEVKPLPEKENVVEETSQKKVCKIYLHLDKILLITIISCAVLMKLIMDFPEFLLFILISIIFTSALAYGYLYPKKSMKVFKRFMMMNMLVNPMAIGF